MDRPLHCLAEDIALPAHRRLAADWLALSAAAGNRVPALRDFDPGRHAGIADDLWILDAEPHGQLRFRLAGRNLSLWYGTDLAGRTLLQTYVPALAADLGKLAQALLQRPCAGWHRGRHRIPGWVVPVPFERIGLPLCDDAGQIRHLAGFTRLGALAEPPPETDRLHFYPLADAGSRPEPAPAGSP
ncbi:PAS domain-containing protein [Ferrovibrio sp.]|uniref:PAS domain-containing protein n=1 Tax=Ferrovibrio sp. TaxID=1917215 RepID=UPI00311E4F6A